MLTGFHFAHLEKKRSPDVKRPSNRDLSVKKCPETLASTFTASACVFVCKIKICIYLFPLELLYSVFGSYQLTDIKLKVATHTHTRLPTATLLLLSCSEQNP